MASIEQYQNDIRRYQTLKSNLSAINTNISAAANSVDNVSNELKTKYVVNDGAAPITNRTQKLKSDITATYTYISTKVIPAIDTAIYNLQKKIEELERQERMAQERAAALATRSTSNTVSRTTTLRPVTPKSNFKITTVSLKK